MRHRRTTADIELHMVMEMLMHKKKQGLLGKLMQRHTWKFDTRGSQTVLSNYTKEPYLITFSSSHMN